MKMDKGMVYEHWNQISALMQALYDDAVLKGDRQNMKALSDAMWEVNRALSKYATNTPIQMNDQ